MTDRYLLTISNPELNSSPFTSSDGIIFRGIVRVSKNIIDGKRSITSIKSNSQELLINPGSGNDNKLLADTLQPTGGDNPSGFSFNLPATVRHFLQRHFGDTSTFVNVWDNYDGIMMETLSYQYNIIYSMTLYVETSWFILILIIFMVWVYFLMI